MPSTKQALDLDSLQALVDDLTLVWPVTAGGEQLTPAELIGHAPRPGESAASLFLWWTCCLWYQGLDGGERRQLLDALQDRSGCDGHGFLAGFATTLRAFDETPASVGTALGNLHSPATDMASAVIEGLDVGALIEGPSPLTSVLEYLTSAAWCLAAASRSTEGLWLSSLSGDGSRWLPVEGALDVFLLNAYQSGLPFLLCDPALADALPRSVGEWLRPGRSDDLSNALPARARPLADTGLLLAPDQLVAVDGRRLRVPGSPGRAAVVFGRSWCDGEEFYVEGLLDDGARILPLELVGRNALEDFPRPPQYVCRAHTQAFISDPKVESATSDTLLSAVALALGDAILA